VLLAEIGELDGDLSSNLIVGGGRDANAARLGDTFKPRGHIDSVAEDVVPLDQHVAQIDPDPEQHPTVMRDAFVALGHRCLHGDRAFYGIDNRGELDEHAIARGLDDTAAMLRHQRVAHNTVLAQRARSPSLVEPHEPAVAGHVGGKDSCQPAFDPTRSFSRHGVRSPSEAMLHDQATNAQYAPERLLSRGPA